MTIALNHATTDDHSLIAITQGDGAVVANTHAEATRALVSAWLAWLHEQAALGQLSDATVVTYAKNIARWVDFLESIARTDRPTPGTVSAYVAALIPGHRPGSVNALVSAAKSLYRWAESRDLYPNIARSSRALRVANDGALPALTQVEVAALVASIDGAGLRGLRDRALVCLFFSTAFRCVSVARADVGDLDMDAGTLRHQPKGHSGKDTLARLTPIAVAALRTYLTARQPTGPSAPLFAPVGNHRGADDRLTTRSMRGIVLKLMERQGHARRDAAGRLTHPGVYSAHSLRRSALTTAYESNGLESAQTLAGHASAETTKRSYVRTQKDRQLQALTQALDLPLSVLGAH